ncbi:MAG TPA: hypothetical protein VN512_13100 [Clostridia bacterium]|nr:hypothetical protein [Clostridia bacterium]
MDDIVFGKTPSMGKLHTIFFEIIDLFSMLFSQHLTAILANDHFTVTLNKLICSIFCDF